MCEFFLSRYAKVFLFYMFISISTNLDAQTAPTVFNRSYKNINVKLTFSKLVMDKTSAYLNSPVSTGVSLGYDHVFSLNNYYGIGLGGELGYMQYMLKPVDNELALYYTKSNVIAIRFPLYINKFYQLYNRFAMNIKTGVSVNTVISSLTNFGSFTIDDRKLFSTYVNVNGLPQIGGLFDIGFAYHLKNQNFLTVNLSVLYNFKERINLNYEYYSQDGFIQESGTMFSRNGFLGLNMSYNFNSSKE